MTTHMKDFSAANAQSVEVPRQVRKAPSIWKYSNGFKRALDVLLVVASLPVVLPVLVLIAIAAATDGASPFYRQRRIGKDGRIFDLLKIRTMVPNAHERLQEFLDQDPDAKAEWESTQKLKSDPRITPVGKFLRKSSLDELPQLWNVLVGDMSIVGPRPMMVDQKALYPGQAYYKLRPGITGSWQVSERNASTFADRAKFDTDYHQNLTFLLDVSILTRTVGVVLRGTGY